MMDDLMKVPIADDVITMTDCKERIAHMQDDAAFRHIISDCGADGRVWFDKKFICDYVAHLKFAIEQLAADIDVARKERDAAIGELRSIGDNCFCCRWWEDEPSDGDWSHNHCSCPDTCCADGNPDRWEWRGVPDE